MAEVWGPLEVPKKPTLAKKPTVLRCSDMHSVPLRDSTLSNEVNEIAVKSA